MGFPNREAAMLHGILIVPRLSFSPIVKNEGEAQIHVMTVGADHAKDIVTVHSQYVQA